MNRKLKNEELGRLSESEFKLSSKIPLVVVMDNVRSMHNVGSVFRTSDAFAIEKIYLCGITAQPPHREIEKTALGATNSVDWAYAASSLDLCNQLKSEGYTLLAIEQASDSIALQDLEIDKAGKFALVFGHEVHGVEQGIIDVSDAVIEIPQSGTKHSLNLSVSAGILLWTFYKAFIRK